MIAVIFLPYSQESYRDHESALEQGNGPYRQPCHSAAYRATINASTPGGTPGGTPGRPALPGRGPSGRGPSGRGPSGRAGAGGSAPGDLVQALERLDVLLDHVEDHLAS